jgi:outer membrane protein OmpU
MKKTLLLGTTALMAAGFLASGVAQAAEEPLVVGFGGYVVSGFAAVSQENEDGGLADNANSFVIGNDVQINASASTTLDNGITAGFSLNLEAGGAEQGTYDERFAFLRGSFGQIRLGQTPDARREMSTTAPGAAAIFGINSPWFKTGNSGGILTLSTSSDGQMGDDAIKLVYFSPVFNGFRLGASYASTGNGNGFYDQLTAEDVAGNTQNGVSGAIEYNGNFGESTIRISGGMSNYVLERCNASAAVQTCNDNPQSLHVGGRISFGDFSVGAGMLNTEQSGLSADGSNIDRLDYDIGLSWGSGSLSAALLYGEVELDIADDTTDSLSVMEMNAQYVLGPGISLSAAIVRGDFDDATEDNAGGLDNSYTEVKAGAAMFF